MTSFRHRAGRGALLPAALAVGLLGATPASAVTGGAPVQDGSHAFIVKIDIGGGDEARSCTGALIDPQWVITARACFTAGGQPPAAGVPAASTRATIGRVDLTGAAGQVRRIVRLAPHPERDLVLARLDRPTDIPPVVIGTAAPAAGDSLTVAGFGRTATEWVPDRLHAAGFQVIRATEDGLLEIAGGGPAQATLCKGDAGGPALREAGGRVELVAINHTSWQNGCLGESGTRQGASATRLDVLNDWICQHLPGDVATDARADVTLLYGYSTGAIAPFTFATQADHTFSPRSGFRTPPEAFDFKRVRLVRGDFNGDGTVDLAVLHGAKDGSLGLHTFLANPDGQYQAPLSSWKAPRSWGAWDRLKLTSGDYNGDGRVDLAAFYAYPDSGMGLLTFIARPDGGFEAPVRSWHAPKERYFGSLGRMRIFSGDFNGDGRDDVATFYGYADNGMGLISFLSTPEGGFNAPFRSWYAPKERYFGSLGRMKIAAGDYNGDGRSDVAVLYGYANGNLGLITFTANAEGGFNGGLGSWSANGASWGRWDRTRLVSGDYNADGRTDLAALQGAADESLALHTFTARPDGGFDNPARSWHAAPGAFGWFGSIKFEGE